GAREAVGAAPGRQAAAPRRQRGFFGRREEAQRDLPDGGAGTEAGDPGRDRLGARHRRPAPRRRGRQRPALPGPRLPGDHPLPAPARVHPPGRGARAGRRPDRRERRAGAGRAAGRARLFLGQGPHRTGGRMSALLQSLASGFEGDAARRAALDAALGDGLPGPRSEAWKYTPLRALERREFTPSSEAVEVDPALLADIPAPRLVFVNGRHAPALSDQAGLGEGISIDTGAAAGGADGRYADRDAVFARLAATLARDGVTIRVDAGAKVERPLHLVFIGAPRDGAELA